ncbi:MAG: hypothetical protein U0992_09015 [Planctomycetaceae bacterium]
MQVRAQFPPFGNATPQPLVLSIIGTYSAHMSPPGQVNSALPFISVGLIPRLPAIGAVLARSDLQATWHPYFTSFSGEVHTTYPSLL